MDHTVHDGNAQNRSRYEITAWVYDILDCPWERIYRKWRPELLGDLRGKVLEAGVGTGRNLRFYPPAVDLTALDLSGAMIRKAARRARKARCRVTFVQEDACRMSSVAAEQFDWVIATFLCCVIPSELQPFAVRQFERVLKPGGRFRLLEMVHSNDPVLRRRQDLFAPFVRSVYGAGFDRDTLKHVNASAHLRVTGTRFLKNDTYLLIEGWKVA